MKSTNITFKSTKKKISFTFAVLSGLLMTMTTLVIMLIVRYQMRLQAQSFLSKGLASVSADFQANNLEEVSIAFQSDKTKTEEYEAKSRLSNIVDIGKSVSREDSNESLIQKDTVFVADEESFRKLKENRQVYSRVILANGDILYSSDLFDALSVNPDQLGFYQYSIRGICIYAHTEKITVGDQKGSTIQVAQYCPFTTNQQQVITFTMVMITFFASLLAYIVGMVMASYFLKPLQKSATQTRVFAQNVYHELFTPVSVAITTVAAALRRKKYQKGLESVNDDLTQIQESLQLLSDKAFKQQAELSVEKINISLLLRKIILENKNNSNRSDLKIDLSRLEKSIYKSANRASTRLVLQNLIENAYKFTKENSNIKILLSANNLIISNQVDNINDINIKSFFTRYYRGDNSVKIDGKGLGLSLVKELVEIQGWKIKAKIVKNYIEIVIGF